MSGLQYNLRVQQGATYKKVFKWLDAAGQLKPIGNWTAHAQIKTGYGVRESLLDLSTQTGEIVLIDGYLTILLSQAQTRSLPVVYSAAEIPLATYRYDLFVTDPQGNVKQFLYGTVLVKGALTDD